MKKRRRGLPGWLIALFVTGALCGLALPKTTLWSAVAGVLVTAVVTLCAASVGKAKRKAQEARELSAAPSSASRTNVESITAEGRRAVREMQRLRLIITDRDIQSKIDRLIDVSGKIVADVAEDPSDAPRVKKFLDYYLPTTIKLLNAYERMSNVGVEGENVSRSKASISSMLDTAIEAYTKQLDSLFENQALDIETDITVMNSLLTREGLTGESSDSIILDAARGAGQAGSAAALQKEE